MAHAFLPKTCSVTTREEPPAANPSIRRPARITRAAWTPRDALLSLRNHRTLAPDRSETDFQPSAVWGPKKCTKVCTGFTPCRTLWLGRPLSERNWSGTTFLT